GLRGSKKLKPGAFSLYVGDGHRAAVEVFQKEVENQLRKTIKSLRSDRGGEYMSQEFLDHLKKHEIIAHCTPPYTSQNNEVSEGRNRTLLDMVRSMMSQTTLPKSFWDYAFETAARILNMVPTKKVDKTPYEIWHAPSENKVFVARNAEFFESKVLDLKASGSVEDLELIQVKDTNPSVDTGLNHEEDDQEIDEPQSDINPIRKSSRTRHAPDRMCLYIDDEEHELGDLATLLDPESKKWLDAMNVEMQSIKDNDVKRSIGLCQKAYIEKILKRFYMENSKRGMIPLQEKLKLSKSQGSIMYAVRCTRPDVAFAQNMTTHFQQMSGKEPWTAVKNILKYLHNTKDMILVYGGNMERELRVSCYTDVGYLADADNLKSQTGFVLGIVPTIEEPISMYCDNTGAIAIAKDDGVTKGARHFYAKVHYLCETIKLSDVKIEKIDTNDNLDDPFIKALAFPKHSELTRNIRLLPASSFM
nr:hypothetical protein [Tanacetum cinerariifolium]